MTKMLRSLLVLGCVSTLVATNALAQPFPGEILDVDETGGPALLHPGPSTPAGSQITGYINPTLGQDPISGITTLCFALPCRTVPGDVLLFESQSDTQFSDLLRFVPDPTRQDLANLYFFSELEPTEPNPDPADVGLPQPVGSPVSLFETGPEGNNGAFYHPGPNDPGFSDPSGPLPDLSYNFISDVPEPGSLSLLLAGAGLWGLRMLRRKS